MTALEPGIFLLAEHVKEGRQALRTAQEKADREADEALAAARAKDDFYRQKPSTDRQIGRQAGEGETVTRSKLAEAACRPAGQPVETAGISSTDRQASDLADDQPSDRLPPVASPVHSEYVFTDAETHARHLISFEGVRHRNELARRVHGLSHYRAAQLLDELAADWREKRGAPKH